MPSLVLFQRKTFIGGDDLQPTCCIAILLRVVQLIILLLPILIHLLKLEFHFISTKNNNESDNFVNNTCYSQEQFFSEMLLSYFILAIIYSIASITTEYALWKASGIGTPTKPLLRTEIIVKILERKLIPFALFNFIIFMLGIVSILFSFSEMPMNDDRICQDDDHDDNAMLFPFSNVFSKNIWRLCFLFMLTLQVFEVVVSLLSLLHIYSLPKIGSMNRQTQEILDVIQHNSSDVYQSDILWENRCRFWCKFLSFVSCYIFGGQEVESGDYTDIARVLTDYFEHEGILDIVPSDIVAAFVILQKKQKKKDNENREIVLSRTNTDSSSISHDRSCNLDSKNEQISPLFSHMEISSNPSHQKQRTSFPEISEQMYSTSSILLPENKVDLDIIAEGARFSRHALAIYTWVLYVYMKPFCGVCSLSSIKLRDYCCTCPCSPGGNKSDDCDDLESNFYHYDHFHSGDDDLMRGKQAIIGDNYCGLHKEALLTIAALKDSELIYGQFEDGIRTTPYCIVLDHAWKSVVVSIRGTLSLEDCVVDVIVDAKPLDDLGKQWNFDGKGEYCHAGILDCTVWIMEDLISHGFLHQLLNMQYPDYTLRIVGHSFGAGCAVLLSKMLRKQYPTLRCLSYSPPGGFCTYRSATECKDFVTSYILDSDLVPRLSIENMENLRDEILTIIGQINVPKMSVLRSIFSRENTWESMLHNPNEDSEYSHQLSLFKGIQQNRKSQRNKVNVSLYPPGRIVHLIKPTDQGTPCYIPIWSENDSFHEIVVSPTMGTDHFPNKVCQELEKVARSFGLSINLGSTF